MMMACLWPGARGPPLARERVQALGPRGPKAVRGPKACNPEWWQIGSHAEKSKTIWEKKEHTLIFLHPGSRHVETLAGLTGKESYQPNDYEVVVLFWAMLWRRHTPSENSHYVELIVHHKCQVWLMQHLCREASAVSGALHTRLPLINQ